MKSTQKFTPKYWVFHNTTSDAVYLDTASKNKSDCLHSVEQLYTTELQHFYENDDSPYKISLIEIKLVINN
jgi:hypothetical protein